jgi:ATP-dependent DNA helicase RecG
MDNLLKSRLTPLQYTKVTKVGVQTMYDLITYLPFRLEEIEPFTSSQNADHNKKYLLNGFIASSEIVFKSRKYFRINISGDYDISVLFFSYAPYLITLLNSPNEFQFLLQFQNGFWVIDKLIEKKPNPSKDFILGRAEMRKYLVPRYLKNRDLTNTLLKNIHTRLHDSDYLLSLENLVPPNKIIPNIINLKAIHKPTSYQDYTAAIQQYTSLKVFLRLALINYINQINKTKTGKLSKLDASYLKKISAILPYQLSPTQKTTTWELLQKISY